MHEWELRMVGNFYFVQGHGPGEGVALCVSEVVRKLLDDRRPIRIRIKIDRKRFDGAKPFRINTKTRHYRRRFRKHICYDMLPNSVCRLLGQTTGWGRYTLWVKGATL